MEERERAASRGAQGGPGSTQRSTQAMRALTVPAARGVCATPHQAACRLLILLVVQVHHHVALVALWGAGRRAGRQACGQTDSQVCSSDETNTSRISASVALCRGGRTPTRVDTCSNSPWAHR